MYVGIVVGLPPMIIPLLFPAAVDKNTPIVDRYITKVLPNIILHFESSSTLLLSFAYRV
jgi:hypothetical protein